MIRSKQVLIILSVIAVALGAIVGFQIFDGGNGVLMDAVEQTREVAVANVGVLNNNLPTLPTVGTVESQTEATLRSETSGEVRAVYVSQGQFVQAGTILVELSNGAEHARLLQAEASVESAEAALEKVRSGARQEDISILQTRVAKETRALADARSSVVSTLNTVFANIEGALFGGVDQMFSNPRDFQPRLSFYADDANDLEWERVLIGEMIREWSLSLDETTSESDLGAAIDTADAVVAEMRQFVTHLLSELNDAQPNSHTPEATLTAWKSALSGAQADITASVSVLSSSESTLNAQRAALAIVEEELDRTQSGERSEDVIAAEARLKQAEAGLAEARVLFAKTQVRTPISGTVNELFIERGDFVSAFSDVAIVSNNNALQITTFITEDERPFVISGALVEIDRRYEGIITSVAPALDSQTKKIEVHIGISEDVQLTNGESVQLSIQRTGRSDTVLEDITLPLSALKIRPRDIVVFTVDTDNVLVAHPVTLGSIVGERVIILSGVSADMEVVLDARGLREGDSVTRSVE